MRRSVFVAMSAASAFVVAARAQQQPPQVVERVSVTRVVIDARVIDEFGAPVRGLSESNFIVNIGGKPARVQMVLWTGDDPPGQAPGATLASRSTAGFVEQPGQLVVLLFQKSLHNDRAWGLIRMVEQSRDLIRSLPTTDRIAVLQFENSLRVYSDFTNDREALDRVLTRMFRDPAPATVERGEPSLIDTLTPRAARKIGTMEKAFGAIAEALRPMPGSKAIAYVGYGMGIAPFGIRQDLGAVHARFGTPEDDLASRFDMNNDYKKARRSLNEARVSVFSLDVSMGDTHSFAGSMQAVAHDTGGFYAHSVDFPERPMRFVTGALNAHYVLFVEPAPDAADRGIDVSVSADRRASVFATSSYRAPER